MAEKKLLMTQVYDAQFPPSFPVKGALELAVSDTSAATAVLNGDIVLVRPTIGCYVAWGAAPTATTTTGDGNIYCFADEWTEIHVGDGNKIAAILSAGTATLYVRYPNVQELRS